MDKGIIEILQTEMLDFTAPVLINNLPAIDGLLVSQRQVIWGMKKAGMTSDKQFYKMLKASGRIFDYYVLGDIPLCGVMKNMGNNYILNKYLMPKGSFGNKNFKKSKGSAPRYIECKLNPYSECMLEGINKNAVTMKWNYDATEKEPIILPSKIPNILTNLRMSIAVSESNKMPSHNMEDTCNSIISYIKTKDIEKSIELIKVPDLPSGGAIIYNKKDFEKIYKEGNGSFTLIGKYKYDKENNIITIYEIPYVTYIENIEEELEAKLDKFSKELIDYHNGSDKDGLKLELYLKKNADVNTVIQKLRKFTSFESKFSCNFVILDLDGKTPLCMSLEQIINKWIIHRRVCIKNELQFDNNKLNKKLHQLEGLKLILTDLDRAIYLIRNSKNDEEAIENIKMEFKIDNTQAEYIVAIKLLNINKGFISNKLKDIDNINKEISYISNILSSDNNINNIIIEQLEDVKKKYNQPRKTDIIYEDTIAEITSDDLIEDYTTTIIMSKEQYIKKTRKYSTTQKLKDGDEILNIQQCSNKGKIILLTNLGNAFLLNINDLEDKLPSQLGTYLSSLIDLQKDEYVLNMLVTDNYSGHVMIVFENGKIAKVPISSYKTKTNRKMLSNSLSLESKVVSIYQIDNDVEIELTDSFGKQKTINTSDINEKSKRDTIGVQVHNSKRQGFKIVSSKMINQ
jgi:DNA gyrase/topoisomerase IV subunit A